MKKIIYILTVLFLLTGTHLTAKDWKVKDIPMVHLQDATRYVVNPEGILSASAVATIDSILFALEQKTGIQTIVAVVSGIDGGDCFEFAYQLGKQNGVGQKQRDNGLVILLSTEERCIQFVTGYGLEGDLPDAICKRIQNRYMNGYFSQNKWNEGMVAGIRAVGQTLDGSMENIDDGDDDEDLTALGIFMLFFLIVIAISFYAVWRASACPNCKKHHIQRLHSNLLYKRNGVKREEVTYICKDCGHTFKRIQESADESYRGPRGGGGIFIGGSGGGFGGGGFSGGSFGGGGFGGGGAGSRF